MGANGSQGWLKSLRRAVETSAVAPIPRWERNLVVAALAVHAADVVLDGLVALLFLIHLQWGFFFATAGVLSWAWIISSLYISCRSSVTDSDIDGDVGGSCLQKFLCSFIQVQIFAEAYKCVFRTGDTDDFYTLRLMEALFESAPSTLLQLYALVLWVGLGTAPDYAGTLLGVSILVSVLSVGIGLAMWERKVQIRTSSAYTIAVVVMRTFEIASRGVTLAMFALFTYPTGIWWTLLTDYCLVLFLIVRNRAVPFTYGIFVAVPLVLVSLEPLVWRAEDHAVPKDAYYVVRLLEFILMWALILMKEAAIEFMDASRAADLWRGCKVVAVVSTVSLYVMLPALKRIARHYELPHRFGEGGGEDGEGDSEEFFSDSEGSAREMAEHHNGIMLD